MNSKPSADRLAERMEIGRRVGEHIEKSGRSQRQVALAAGIDPTALSKAIAGKRGLSPTQVKEIARILGVDPAVLLLGAVSSSGAAGIGSVGLSASEAIAAYIERHPLDLTPREKTILDGLRNRLGSDARVSEADVAQLLRIVREVFLAGDR